jgi:hypothetical protein
MQLSQRKVMVRLKGGIGNQLFQYAFALHLANGDPRHVICLLDYFRSDPRHGGFALALLLGPEVLTVETPPGGHQWVSVNADSLADADLSFLRYSNFDIFIDGYFQHAANFSSVTSKLRSMFAAQFDQGLYERKLKSCLDRESCEVAVAFHLRRGDFLDPEVRKVHGIPSPESMASCFARIGTPDFCAVVFSDSKVAIELPCRGVYLSSGEPRSLAGDIDQLRLMSCCSWIIASNSTFSYWAGILSNQVRRIFLPDPWMRSGSVRTESLLTSRVESYSTQLL